VPPNSYAAASTGGTGTDSAWGASGVEKRGGGRKLGLVAGLLVLAGAAVAGALVLRHHAAETPPAPTSDTKPTSAAALTAHAEPSVATPATTGPSASAKPAPEVTPAPVASAAASPHAAPEAAAAEHAKPAAAGKSRPSKPSAKSAAAAPAPSPTAATAPTPAAAAKPAPKVNLYDDRK
jgi:hypothetical protein